MGTIELIVTGNVQRVGYRNIVSQAAFELGINGYAKNLPDESVRIVVQGDERKIEKFIGKIKIRKWPINVEDIKQRKIAAKKPFRKFTISRGKPAREMAERADEAALYMHKMYGEMHGMRGEMHGMRGEMHGFRKETNGNFGKLDVKYGSLSNKMDGFSGKLAKKMDNVSGKLDSTNKILKEDLSNKMDNVSGKLDSTNKILKEDLSNKMDNVSGKLDDTNKILREEFSKLSNALLIIANKAIQK